MDCIMDGPVSTLCVQFFLPCEIKSATEIRINVVTVYINSVYKQCSGEGLYRCYVLVLHVSSLLVSPSPLSSRLCVHQGDMKHGV